MTTLQRPPTDFPTRLAAPVMNRWLVVIGAIIIQVCLGAIYAWSVFTADLQKAPFAFTKTQTQVIFSVALAVFAVFTIIGGRWQAKAGPTLVVRAGGALLALGYVLACFAGASFPGLVATIGVIGGAGIGLAYVVPIAVGVKWFPDKKGLITGLAVAGFGFGALLWIQLAGPWGGLIVKVGVSKVFLYYGIAFLLLILLGSLWMKNPPAGWLPAGWSPGESKGAAGALVNFESAQMLATPQFWQLWLMYICGALAGLMVIGIIKLFGTEALQARAGLDAAAAGAWAATAMGVFFACFNGIGRIAWGFISDAIGRKFAMTVMLTLQGAVMIAFFYMGGHQVLLFVGAALIGFNFGGTLALFPAATADFFGNKNVGKNYGWMFTAYGVGGIVGPIMAAAFADASKGKGVDAWLPAFLIAGIACLVAALLAGLLRAPRRPALREPSYAERAAAQPTSG
ncbi:MAG: OFA family MFS transporter [Planctomycetota bacterium]